MATRKQIEDTRSTVEGLCTLARQLGYKDPCYQLQNRDGSVVGDMLYFFEDNPGAIEAVIEWVLENNPNGGVDDDEDEDDEDDEDEDEEVVLER